MLAGDLAFDDDEPAPRLRWLRRSLGSLGEVPQPGSGRTSERWLVLADLATADASLARLVEGHLDALAILTELGRPSHGGGIRAVWAARPALLAARPERDGWHLVGPKPWCSGAAGVDRALITATDAEGGARLFDVPVTALRFADDWHPAGMRASDSRTADIDVHVGPESQVGGVGAYVGRPGFWHGGAGVAACWYGVARRVAADLVEHARAGDDPYIRAAAGQAVAALAAAGSLLGVAAAQVDEQPDDEPAARRRAQTVRVAVEGAARHVVQLSLATRGATPLCFDGRHARAVVDLEVYLGQLHGGHDAAAVAADPAGGWWGGAGR